jgi:hypothetical protein
MKRIASRVTLLTWLALTTAFGCRSTKPDAATVEAPPSPNRQPVRIDYVDTDAFDVLFETALLNADPVIFIQTGHNKPDWGPRLNAWIAAWNVGGRTDGSKVRGQIPPLPKVVVDGDSIREFRLLIDDLMGRVEESARAGTQWWAERRMRERRVALLKPYNLRFHVDDKEQIQLIFFHGQYAAYHAEFVRSLGQTDREGCDDWVRGYCCSRCKNPPAPDRPSPQAPAQTATDHSASSE